MNVVRLLILLAVLVAGLIIGALNSDKMVLSLGFTQITTTTGLAIIVALYRAKQTVHVEDLKSLGG